MKIALSPRHRGALFVRLHEVADWGGSEDALTLRAEIWRALMLDVFKKSADTLSPEKLSTKTAPFELTRPQAEHVVAAVASQKCSADLAMTFAEIITAIRAVFPREKPEAPPS